jgi:hypothetical protein
MRIAAAHRGSEMRLRRTWMRTLGLAMVVLLALTQVGAALHFAMVQHALSPDASVLVHCDDLTTPGPSNGPAPTRSRETCEIFAVLCQATDVSAPAPALVAASPAVHEWSPAPTDSDVVSAWPIFMLAPSHSPPGLAA